MYWISLTYINIIIVVRTYQNLLYSSWSNNSRWFLGVSCFSIFSAIPFSLPLEGRWVSHTSRRFFFSYNGFRRGHYKSYMRTEILLKFNGVVPLIWAGHMYIVKWTSANHESIRQYLTRADILFVGDVHT